MMRTTLIFQENGNSVSEPKIYDYKNVEDCIGQINDYIINLLVFEDFEDFNVKSNFFELWSAKDLETKQKFAQLILEKGFNDEKDLFESYGGDISLDLTNISYMLNLLLQISEKDTETSWQIKINYIMGIFFPSVEITRLS